jgi:hypothetical protein
LETQTEKTWSVTSKQGGQAFMKIECPECGKTGIVERRGNSVRIVHYQYTNGKRKFVKHTMGTAMGTEKPILSPDREKAPPKGLEPLTDWFLSSPMSDWLSPMSDWLTASRSTGLSYGGTTTTHPLSVQQKYLRIVICGKPLILSVSLCA